jgi:hypothetical protein
LYARYSGACCWHPGQLLEGISGCLEQDSPEVRAWYGIWDVSRGYLTYADAGIGLVGGQKGSPLIASQDTYPEQVLDFVGQETAVFAEGATSSKLEDIMTDLERDVSRDVLIVHPRPPCQSLSAGDIETVMTSLEEPNLDLRYSVRALCETIVAHSPRAWIRWWSGEDRFDISVVLPPEAVPWSLSPLDRRLEWQQDLRLLFDEVEVSPDGHELSARYLLD